MDFSGGVLTVYGPNETASIFATYPSEYLTLGRSFLDQVSRRICVNFNQKAYLNSCSEIIISEFALLLGSGHWHADVVHPGFG